MQISEATEPAHKPENPFEPAFITRIGPHIDLLDYVDFLESKPDITKTNTDNEEILELSHFSKRMLESGSQEERVNAAHALLKRNLSRGLAYAVLAREGADSIACAQKYFELALACLKEEWERHEKLVADHSDAIFAEPYSLDKGAHVLIASDSAELFWRQGQRQEAVDKLLPILLSMSYAPEETTLRAISWLVQQGDDEKALELLNKDSMLTGQWHYMKALVLFRSFGNTIISRASLWKGLNVDRLTPDIILGIKHKTAPSRADFADERVRLLAFEIKAAWKATPGAIEWLTGLIMASVSSVFRLGLGENDANRDDTARIKRWQELIDTAYVYLQRGDYRECKKLVRSALREAQRFGFTSSYLSKTLDLLIELVKESGSSDEEILTVLDERICALEKLVASDNINPALPYLAFAKKLQALEKYERAEALFKRALEPLDKLLADDEQAVSLHHKADLLFRLAKCVGEQKRYTEAASLFRQSLELQEKYLGKAHPEQLPALDYLARCWHHLGKHEEEQELRQRISRLDIADLFNPKHDPHKGHGTKCAWSHSPCRATVS